MAKELPPKTEIIRPHRPGPEQRDLYETIRAVDARKGPRRHRRQRAGAEPIIVLDALLKLRQVCCDPRLVKIAAAAAVAESAKLDGLIEMVSEMVPEGRRILIFSQFTSMLDLIKPELNAGRHPVRGTHRSTPRPRPRRSSGSSAARSRCS